MQMLSVTLEILFKAGVFGQDVLLGDVWSLKLLWDCFPIAAAAGTLMNVNSASQAGDSFVFL